MKKIFMFFLLLSTCASAQSSLRYMYFLDENIGWVQTTDFPGYTPIKSYRTTNGGITWTQLDSQYNYKSIQFLNDSIGFLLSGRKKAVEFVGDKLYKTTDKGASWQFLKDSLFQVEFADDRIGYAYKSIGSHPHSIACKTIDGGVSWERMESLGAVSYTSILKVINRSKVAIIDDNGKVLSLSTDSGKTWTIVRYARTDSDYNVHSALFPDSMNGYLGTSQQDQTYTFHGTIIKTTDGGLTWAPINVDNNIMLYYLSLTDSINGVAWDWYGESYYITHGGFTTWEKKFCNSLARYYLYKDCKEFYVSGDSGYFAKSTDCGDTWTEIPFVVLNPTDVDENNSTITNYSLEQNYPNPFNPSTTIKYSLPTDNFVSIKIFDLLGNEIAILVNEEKSSGEYEITWNASAYPSGVYFMKMTSGKFTETKKMLLMK
ncbi:MAG TPA: T9SS type A sorting domain-containing protein [Ignavibacteriaceae bacterium]|nr:T9SS type A sorting domain-containing protein [Ignavibacteriaceae bacterium]